MTWQERLHGGIRIDPHTGCHLWTRAQNGKGYGVLWADGKLQLTHRLAWLERHGSLPAAGRVLDHIGCDNPSCCNVEHLRECDNGANIQRAYPRGDAATEARRAAWRSSQQTLRSRRAAS